VAGVGVHELSAVERDLRVGHVEAEDRLHVVAFFQPARELAAEEARDAGDQDSELACSFRYG
jgi:hypothetical protein